MKIQVYHMNYAVKAGIENSGLPYIINWTIKNGKTILCEKVIGFDNIVEISGADFNSNTDFWAIVAL
ncbi:MAG: hypothetical protein ACLU8S_06250 [Coprococcus phoceensis]